MSHELGKSMEGNGCGHTVTKAMSQVVWAHVTKLRSLRSAAFHSAVEELVDADRLDEAESFIARVPSGRFGETAILSARSKVELGRSNVPFRFENREAAWLLPQ